MTKKGRQAKLRRGGRDEARDGTRAYAPRAHRPAIAESLRGVAARATEVLASTEIVAPTTASSASAPAPGSLSIASDAATEEATEESTNGLLDGDAEVLFFASAPAIDRDDEEAEAPDPRLAALRSVAAEERRAYLARYVAGIVAACFALLLGALVKASLTGARSHDAHDANEPAPSRESHAESAVVPR